MSGKIVPIKSREDLASLVVGDGFKVFIPFVKLTSNIVVCVRNDNELRIAVRHKPEEIREYKLNTSRAYPSKSGFGAVLLGDLRGAWTEILTDHERHERARERYQKHNQMLNELEEAA